METSRRLLLVKDGLKNIGPTLISLDEHDLVNEVAVARDGVKALDEQCRPGSFTRRPAIRWSL